VYYFRVTERFAVGRTRVVACTHTYTHVRAIRPTANARNTPRSLHDVTAFCFQCDRTTCKYDALNRKNDRYCTVIVQQMSNYRRFIGGPVVVVVVVVFFLIVCFPTSTLTVPVYESFARRQRSDDNQIPYEKIKIKTIDKYENVATTYDLSGRVRLTNLT